MKQKTSLQFALYIRISANATRKCAENIEKRGVLGGLHEEKGLKVTRMHIIYIRKKRKRLLQKCIKIAV